jgi:choline-glycine betaine transporter
MQNQNIKWSAWGELVLGIILAIVFFSSLGFIVEGIVRASELAIIIGFVLLFIVLVVYSKLWKNWKKSTRRF